MLAEKVMEGRKEFRLIQAAVSLNIPGRLMGNRQLGAVGQLAGNDFLVDVIRNTQLPLRLNQS